MESNIVFYLAVYSVIMGIILLFILSPLSAYLSLRWFRIPAIAKKKILLIGLALAIPCLVLLSLPDIFERDSWAAFFITMIVSLCYCTFLFSKTVKTPLIKSIGLSLGYGLFNVLLICLVVFFLSLISRDRPLLPEAGQWLLSEPAAVADTDNLYFALIGFSVEPNVNTHQAGRQCIQEFNAYHQKKAIAEKQGALIPSSPTCLSPRAPSSSKDLDDLCDIVKADCLVRFRSEPSPFEFLIQKYQFLIDQYIDLYHYSGYSTAGIRGPETPLIQAGAILKAHKLFSVRITLKYLKGHYPESLADLQRDMTFQRQNLLRSDNLLFSMVSASLLNRDLNVYARLLDQNRTQKSFPKELEIPLLSGKEKDLAKALQGEFRLITPIYQSSNLALSPDISSGFPAVIQKLIFKPNATINQHFLFLKNIIEWSRLPADKLASSKIKTLPPPDFLDVAYNPQGVILLSISAPSYEPYMYRLHNLDGLIRLVKIKQKIRQDKVAKDQVEPFLKQDIPYFKNPYANQPMTWDAETETLYFMDPSKEGQKVAIAIPFPNK